MEGKKRKKRRIECLLLEELHQVKLEEFRKRSDETLPHTRDQIRHLGLVLRNEGSLTDALVNAIFKDQALVKAAKLAGNQQQEGEEGEGVVEEEAEPPVVHYSYGYYAGSRSRMNKATARERLLRKSKEHINYLRRLKGKSARKLTREEVQQIEEWVRDKEQWCHDVELNQDYIDYEAAVAPIMMEYEEELGHVQRQLREQEETMERSDQLKKDQKKEKKRIRKKQRVEAEQEKQSTGGGILALLHPTTAAVAAFNPGGGRIRDVSSRLMDQSILEYIPPTDTFSRLKELHYQYLRATGQTANVQNGSRLVSGIICMECGVEREYDRKEAIATCPKCAQCIPFQPQGAQAIAYDHPLNFHKIGNTYERESHSEQWLARIQAKNRRKIPPEVYSAVYGEAKRLGWVTLDKKRVRIILRRLDLTKYYENDVMIATAYNDVPPPELTDEEQATLRRMFKDSQDLFKDCPDEIKQRSNFISYPYFMYQCCYMLSWDHLLPSFPLLTGEDNRRHHDRIWKWMCNNKHSEPGWTFYPTI